jgi:hypothetical protein
MKLVLERSGGVAGLRRPPVAQATAALPAAARAQLEALVGAAGLATLPATLGDSPHDQLGYTLTVTGDDGHAHAIELTLDAAPPPLRALISELRRLAR